MKYYRITYLDSGKKRFKLANSKNSIDAICTFRKDKNITIIKATQIKNRLLLGLIKIIDTIKKIQHERKIDYSSLIVAFEQLASMSGVGIPIEKCIGEVKKSTPNKTLKYVFSNIQKELNSGKSFLDGAKKYQKNLGYITISMIGLAENTGKLTESLEKLVYMLEKIKALREKFKKSLRYPFFVVASTVIAFLIIINSVIPKFKEIFERAGNQLPYPTRVLLFIEHSINNYSIYLILGLAISIFSIKYIFKMSKNIRFLYDKLILKSYFFGKVIFLSSISRFMLIFTNLLESGAPLIKAFDSAMLSINNTYIKSKLSIAKDSIKKGSNITSSLNKTKLFEKMAMQMIKTAEASEKMYTMLTKISKYYEYKLNKTIDNMSSYLEPIMIVLVGLMVLFLAIGTLLPVWNLSQVMQIR